MADPKRSFLFSIAIFATGLNLSCSRTSEVPPPPSPNLPVSWYQLPRGGSTPAQPSSAPNDEPSPAMEASVRAQFRAHTHALEALSEHGTPIKPAPEAQAKDYVPWHLDGMIANFTVTVNGVFGALLGGGVANVKATWQQPAASAPGPAQPAGKAPHIKVTSLLTPKQFVEQFEPAIRTAVASRSVRNEAALRTNLNLEAAKFLTLAKVLNALPSRRGWHVDSLQQQLTFGADGQVTPAVGAGGSVNLYWDWQKSSDPGAAGAVRSSELFRSVEAFALTMGKLIPEALLDSKELAKAGFALDQFQVGVGVMAGAKLGIIEAQAMAQGKIIFKNVDDSDSLFKAELPIGASTPGVYFISNDTTENRLLADQFGARIDGAAGSRSDGLRGYEIPVELFRNGMLRALHMAGFFLKNGVAADTTHWKLMQIETEFDGNLGGQIGLATVVGQGQFILDFDRVTGK